MGLADEGGRRSVFLAELDIVPVFFPDRFKGFPSGCRVVQAIHFLCAEQGGFHDPEVIEDAFE